MRMNRKWWVALTCVAALLIPSVATATTASHHYKVRWDFLLNAFGAASKYGPNDAPPGSNLRCHPSKAHPRPVVLVHGLAADQSDNWAALAPYLANHGYCVFSLTYGNDPKAPGFESRIGGMADMTRSAHVLARFVRHVRQVTGARKVDLVGHSEGGTMPDWYLKFDHGDRYVAHFVDLSGLLHGSTLVLAGEAYVLAQTFGYQGKRSNAPQCVPCLDEFFPTSSWMTSLDAPHPEASRHVAATCPVDGSAVNGVKYTSIATRNDELVWPHTSDFLPAACATPKTGITVHNILIQRQCPNDQSDHLSIAADPNVARDILNALDPAHARHVRCRAVLPSLG